MAKQTFKEKVHATKHLEYIRDDSAIRMRLYKGKDISGKLIRKGTGPIIKRLHIDGKRESDTKYIERARRERQRLQDELEEQAKLKISPRDSTMTFGEFLYYWYDNYVSLLEWSTTSGYRGHIRKLAVRNQDNMTMEYLHPLGAATLHHLENNKHMFGAFFSELQKPVSEGGHGLKPLTVKHHYRSYHAAIEYGVEQGIFKYHLFADEHGQNKIRPPKVSRPGNEKEISASDLRELIKLLGSNRHAGPIITSIYTGLRRSEVLGLRWSDIKEKHGQQIVSVNQTVVRSKERGVGHYIRPWGKTEGSVGERSAISPKLKIFLDHHRQYQKDNAEYNWTEESLVFANAIGEFLNPDKVADTVRTICSSMGRPDMTLRKLRHAYTSLLAEQGVDPKVIMRMLGHTELSTTMLIYDNVRDIKVASVASKMDTAMGEFDLRNARGA